MESKITDGAGVVLARTLEPDNFGDSIINQLNIKDALNGNITTYCEAGSAVKVSVRTGAPVYDTDGAIIGVISAGIRLDTDSFVDELKELYKSEATVFYDDTVIATSIIINGERDEGAHVVFNDDIQKTVVIDGKDYYSNAVILGSKFKTV